MKDKFQEYTLLFILPLQIIFSFFMSNTSYGYTESVLFLVALNVFIILGYTLLSKRFYNAITYLIFVILIFTVFPITHAYLFIDNSDNYVCSNEYVNHIIKDLNSEKEFYSDCKALSHIQYQLSDSILNASIDDSLIGERIYFKKYSVLVEKNKTKGERSLRRPKSGAFLSKTLTFFDSINNPKAKVEIESESLISAIKKKDSLRLAVETKLRNPKLEIRFPDLWIDSVTGFVFGNFKPSSRITLIIQMLQIVTFFIFAIMTNKLIESIGIFRITKKN